jgi:hypothetical protein
MLVDRALLTLPRRYWYGSEGDYGPLPQGPARVLYRCREAEARRKERALIPFGRPFTRPMPRTSGGMGTLGEGLDLGAVTGSRLVLGLPLRRLRLIYVVRQLICLTG